MRDDSSIRPGGPGSSAGGPGASRRTRGVAVSCVLGFLVLASGCMSLPRESGVAPRDMSGLQRAYYDRHLTLCVADMRQSGVDLLFRRPDAIVLETCQCALSEAEPVIRSIRRVSDYDVKEAVIDDVMHDDRTIRRCLGALFEPSRSGEFRPGKYSEFRKFYERRMF